ncbi:glucans biosynthesis glucosyltransferase MdoH [Alteromonas halophila]|uniref:Glucans biosynthesis glucosyltransferase H n=1 Tax=Alteromonas halophila TaxID=516698 RepID=A0A918JP79_9ALTE|nr:glucans biosynthesis glucosyltransferase MdoH [Alteromonas halophila]GGW90826.1 hypothetical protein GCM10007391_26400 [Alteromonas halophila]
MSINLSNQSQSVPPARDLAARFACVKGQLRLLVMALLVIPSTALAGWSLYDIFAANGLNTLESVQLGLGVVLFAWLTMAFWTAVIGFVLCLLRRDPLSLAKQQPRPDQSVALKARHAVVMPVYNEDTARIMVGFEACVRELAGTPEFEHFDFYMLSDTQESALAEAELRGWARLKARLGRAGEHIFYRRREKNTQRKVGNLKDFCERWGAHYESMIVLDADSIMSAERMLDLARRIEQNADTALIQTIPMPVRQRTLFGRFVQFAAQLYSPMLATGLSFWQTDSANYWGHNAIIRISAFVSHCGLPSLSAPGPFGGEILSHDFVEAALLRRAGWKAYLLTDTTGSYEEVPANMVDYAVRDRRWVQGNIQHLGMLGTKGLSLRSRLHFVFGAFAYISSLILFSMLLLGTADALIKATTAPQFFVSDYQLFPSWQVAKQDMMQFTLWGTATLLILPKLLGIVLALLQRRDYFGGAWALLKGAALELLAAVMIAPLMMFYHSFFVLSVFVGHKVRWEAQARDGETVPWRAAIKYTQLMSCLAVVWGVTTWYFTPALFMWLLPVLLPMVLAAPIIRLSSHQHIGSIARRTGIFVTGDELRPCMAIKRVDVGIACFALTHRLPATPALPAERRQRMPVQCLNRPAALQPALSGQ